VSLALNCGLLLLSDHLLIILQQLLCFIFCSSLRLVWPITLVVAPGSLPTLNSSMVAILSMMILICKHRCHVLRVCVLLESQVGIRGIVRSSHNIAIAALSTSRLTSALIVKSNRHTTVALILALVTLFALIEIRLLHQDIVELLGLLSTIGQELILMRMHVLCGLRVRILGKQTMC